MATVYHCIKNRLLALLKGRWPDRHNFAEEIPRTQGDEGQPPILDYFFLDIVPTGMTTMDKERSQLSVLVDIIAHTAAESNSEYLELADEIDKLIRPVFSFEAGAVTIPDASSRVVDRMLHYTFTLRFIVRRAPTETYDFMETLDMELAEREE